MLFAARKRGALLIKPRPLLGSQIKAEIKGFLLVYRLFLYKHWFFLNLQLKDFPEYIVIPCIEWQAVFKTSQGIKVIPDRSCGELSHLVEHMLHPDSGWK